MFCSKSILYCRCAEHITHKLSAIFLRAATALQNQNTSRPKRELWTMCNHVICYGPGRKKHTTDMKYLIGLFRCLEMPIQVVFKL